MAPRYFLEQPPVDDAALLSGAEAHHLAHVMRARPHDEVLLFAGRGEYRAAGAPVRRQVVALRGHAAPRVDRRASRPVTLAVALPKGDRQKFLVEKAVELGVARLIPLETTRGVAQPGDNALDRLRRAQKEASEKP